MFRISLIAFFIFSGQQTYVQPDLITSEVKAFILPGFETLDYRSGDLNGDKKS